MSRVWFTDRDLGKRFPEILSTAGLTVERHHDLFPPDGSDEQWLEHCGRNGRIAITHNERIRYTPNELAAVVQHRVALLVVVGKVPLANLAQNFVDTLPRIEVNDRRTVFEQPEYSRSRLLEITWGYRPHLSGQRNRAPGSPPA